MDQQKRQLIAIILIMLKDIYAKTTQLESMFDSSSIHIIHRYFDPFQSMLNALEIPEENQDILFKLMKVYVEEQMTLDEILLEIENQVLTVKNEA